MKKAFERRRRYYVDARVQGALVRQIIAYWMGVSATFAFIVLVYRVFPVWLSGNGPGLGLLFGELGPLMLASVVLFPMVVFSAMRFSNRFVGPMVRFRRALHELAENQPTNTITLRKGDYWTEVADDINRIVERLQQEQQVDSQPTKATELSDDEVPVEEEAACCGHSTCCV